MKEKNAGIPINQEEIQHYLKDIRRIKVMTPEREKELAVMMKSGELSTRQVDAIHKELLEGNLRFVITVAKQYQNQGYHKHDYNADYLHLTTANSAQTNSLQVATDAYYQAGNTSISINFPSTGV